MAAVDLGVIGKSRKLDHIVVHVRSGSLEQPPTAGNEEGIAGKDGALFLEVKRHVPTGVAGNKKDLRRKVS